MALLRKFTRLLREINSGTIKVIFIPPAAGSTPVHSKNPEFLFRNKYLQEYQELTELPQIGLKIRVSPWIPGPIPFTPTSILPPQGGRRIRKADYLRPGMTHHRPPDSAVVSEWDFPSDFSFPLRPSALNALAAFSETVFIWIPGLRPE